MSVINLFTFENSRVIISSVNQEGFKMVTTLEKVRRLEQYLAVDNSTVDPVMDTTIDKLLIRERDRILELKERLLRQCKQFEEDYSLDSTEFYTRYEEGKMGDDVDFVEWAATIDMLVNIDKRLALLEVQPDNEPDY
jgi:hypothetical protein